VFIGLDDDQVPAFRKHIEEKKIKTTIEAWGNPTIVIRDLDGNELFFWLPERERAKLQVQTAGA
jgi:hypothetical protein